MSRRKRIIEYLVNFGVNRDAAKLAYEALLDLSENVVDDIDDWLREDAYLEHKPTTKLITHH